MLKELSVFKTSQIHLEGLMKTTQNHHDHDTICSILRYVYCYNYLLSLTEAAYSNSDPRNALTLRRSRWGWSTETGPRDEGVVFASWGSQYVPFIYYDIYFSSSILTFLFSSSPCQYFILFIFIFCYFLPSSFATYLIFLCLFFSLYFSSFAFFEALLPPVLLRLILIIFLHFLLSQCFR
jgi:hypothetical protein